MLTLTIVLDSNEYIFGLSEQLKPSTSLLKNLSGCIIKLPRFILDELHDNLEEILLKKLYRLINNAKIEIIEEQIPAFLIEKYQKQLPAEDAVIAGYCELLKVDVLISENRHFLVDFHPKAFKILDAQNFLNIYMEK